MSHHRRDESRSRAAPLGRVSVLLDVRRHDAEIGLPVSETAIAANVARRSPHATANGGVVRVVRPTAWEPARFAEECKRLKDAAKTLLRQKGYACW